jgi:hypothetical protein
MESPSHPPDEDEVDARTHERLEELAYPRRLAICWLVHRAYAGSAAPRWRSTKSAISVAYSRRSSGRARKRSIT